MAYDLSRIAVVADVRSDQTCRGQPIAIPYVDGWLTGNAAIPRMPVGVALLANDVGCGGLADRRLGQSLRRAGLATVFVDLLLSSEQVFPDVASLWHDVDLLAERIAAARSWIRAQPLLAPLPIALIGGEGGGPAAIVSAAARPAQVAAVVVCSQRPDLAGVALLRIEVPTLLCVAQGQRAALAANAVATDLLECEHRMVLVPGRSLDDPDAGDAIAREIVGFVLPRVGVNDAA